LVSCVITYMCLDSRLVFIVMSLLGVHRHLKLSAPFLPCDGYHGVSSRGNVPLSCRIASGQKSRLFHPVIPHSHISCQRSCASGSESESKREGANRSCIWQNPPDKFRIMDSTACAGFGTKPPPSSQTFFRCSEVCTWRFGNDLPCRSVLHSIGERGVPLKDMLKL
jgi:hypothetical protein